MTAKVNLIIDQGSTFFQEVQLFDQNGDALQTTYANGDPIYTSAAQMRKSYQAINAISFDTTLANGVLTLAMNANTTGNAVSGRYVYDAELIASNAVYRIVEGIVTVKPNATRT